MVVWYPYAGWSTSVRLHFTSLQLATNSLNYFMSCIWFDACWCYVAVWLWWCDIHMQAEALQCVFTSLHFSLRLIRWVTSWVVSGSMCVGVTLQCGYGGVISVCRLKHFSATSLHFSLRLIRWVTSWVLSSSMCVGVTLQCGYGGVISVCTLKHWSAITPP